MIVAGGLLFVPSAAIAQPDIEYGKALVALSSDPVSTIHRVEAAKAIAEICRRYADKIPTLSPREEEWLDNELESPRFVIAHESVESSKRFAGRLSRNCLSYAVRLLVAKDRRVSLVYWGLLADTLLNPDFEWHVGNLARKGVVNFSTWDVELTDRLRMLGRHIVSGILVPELQSDAGGTGTE